MKVVVKKPVVVHGYRYNAGCIINVDPADLDIQTMMTQGALQFEYGGYFPEEKAYEALTGYLDEKGVEYMLGEDGFSPLESYMLTLLGVPPRLYHEVVVPGLIEICRSRGLGMKATRYERDEAGCTLQMELRYACSN